MTMPRDTLAILREIREQSGACASPGLPDDVIERFAAGNALLRQAVVEAAECHRRLQPRAAEPRQVSTRPNR